MCKFAVMIVYNTTYHVDCTVSGEFLDWLREQFVPQALEGGLVANPRLLRMMGHYDGGACFALQFEAPSLAVLQRWNKATGKQLHEQLTKQFGNKVAGFTTFMESMEI